MARVVGEKQGQIRRGGAEIMMRFFLFPALINLFFASLVCAQPKTPEESISSDVAPEIREQMRRLYSLNPEDRADTALQLGNMLDKAVPVIPFLIELLGDKGSYMCCPGQECYKPVCYVGEAAQRALIVIGRPSVGPLSTVLLKSEDPPIRTSAAYALGEIGDPSAVDPLITVCGNIKDEVQLRIAAIDALNSFTRDPRLFQALVDLLKDDNSQVRYSAVRLLWNMKDARAVEPLIPLLMDEAPEVKREAILALGELKDARAVEPLIALLKNADLEMKKQAIVALRNNKDARAVEPLISALKDKDPEVRGLAITALMETRDDRAVAPLIMLLKDTDHLVRMQAISALDWLKDKRAVEALIALLKDEDLEIRKRAAFALGSIQDIRAVEPLLSLLDDPDASDAAGTSLYMIVGKDFRQDKAKWQEWWQKNKHTFVRSGSQEMGCPVSL